MKAGHAILLLFLQCLLIRAQSGFGRSLQCFGIDATHPSVCSSHGTCIANDVCICHDNYQQPTCNKRIEGLAFAAGSNNHKQLGVPDFSNGESLQFIRVGDHLGLMRIEAVSAGDGFSLALNSKGEVFAWGYNTYRNLGLGDTTANKDIPTILQGDLSGKRVVSIAACKYHGLAADDDGRVYAWGTNKVLDDLGKCTGGWLGIDQDQNVRYTPSRVVGLKEKAVKVACGRFHSIVLTNKNHLYSWGGAMDGQLGRGMVEQSRPEPGLVVSQDDYGIEVLWADIAAGEKHNIALDIHGNVYTWGASNSGQVGLVNGRLTPLPAAVTSPTLVFPTKSPSTTFVVSIAASHSSSFIALNDGCAYSWGSNTYGELGVPSGDTRVLTPTQITIVGSLGVKELKSRVWVWVVTYRQTLARSTQYCT